jgi:hypothetical protein
MQSEIILQCYSLFMTTFTRRQMFHLAVALPAAGVFTRFNTLVAAERNRVKITDIKAMQIPSALFVAGAVGGLIMYPIWVWREIRRVCSTHSAWKLAGRLPWICLEGVSGCAVYVLLPSFLFKLNLRANGRESTEPESYDSGP